MDQAEHLDRSTRINTTPLICCCFSLNGLPPHIILSMACELGQLECLYKCQRIATLTCIRDVTELGAVIDM